MGERESVVQPLSLDLTNRYRTCISRTRTSSAVDHNLTEEVNMQFIVETRYIPMGSTVPTTQTDYFSESDAGKAEERAYNIYSRNHQVLWVRARAQ